MSLCPELAKGRSADEVGLEIEDVVDGGVGGEESLGGSSGLEFLLLSLASSDWQMRVLRPIVLPHPSWSMAIQQA